MRQLQSREGLDDLATVEDKADTENVKVEDDIWKAYWKDESLKAEDDILRQSSIQQDRKEIDGIRDETDIGKSSWKDDNWKSEDDISQSKDDILQISTESSDFDSVMIVTASYEIREFNIDEIHNYTYQGFYNKNS